jgi:ABC-type branched-subunit amino acid transport system substrate-binding protein
MACVVSALALVAVACGDDDDDSGSAATTAAAAATTAGGSATTAAATATTAGGSATTAAGGTATTAASGGAKTGAPADIVAAARKDPMSGTVGSGLTRGVTDTAIKIGCVASLKNYAGTNDGFKARFDRVNAEGGINGRKIEFLDCEDDNLDDNTNLSITKRLVEQEKVFAVVGVGANFNPPTTDYINKNEVPLVAWGISPGFCGTRWGFGFNGCLIGPFLKDAVPHAAAAANLALAIIKASGLPANQVKFAAQAEDNDTGRAGNAQYKQVFEAAGAQVVYLEANMPTTGTTDFSPYAQAVVKSGANIVFTSTAFSNVGGFSAALTAAGYKGLNQNFVAYVPGLLDSSPQLAAALNGTYVSTQIVPQESQSEYIKQIEKDLTASKAAAGTNILFGTALAYNEADLLVQMLTAAGKDLNTKTFDTAVNGGSFTYTPKEAGGPGALGWPESHFVAPDCAAIMKVNGTKFEQVVPFQCYPSIAV